MNRPIQPVQPEISVEMKQQAYAVLRDLKQNLAARGWFPATSGNLSVRVFPSESATAEEAAAVPREHWVFAITASGKDKTIDTPSDYLLIDGQGNKYEPTSLKPSAETSIHQVIYQTQGAGAILHVHTVWNNLASEWFWNASNGCGSIPIRGVELIKAFNIWDQDATIEVPVVENWTDVPRIAEGLSAHLNPRVPGIMLRKHGIYAWGANAFEAKRHLEAFEFLFEYVIRWEQLKRS